MRKIIVLFCMSLFLASGCSKLDFEVNDAYEKAEIASISIYSVGEDPINVIVKSEIDSKMATVKAFVKEGTNLTRLKLTVSISTGATITPSMDGISDLSRSRTYTIVSPNKIIEKPWTITVAVSPNENSHLAK